MKTWPSAWGSLDARFGAAKGRTWFRESRKGSSRSGQRVLLK